MPRKCIYCGSAVDDGSVIDFCQRCGVRVWGEKMFNTIVKNMEDARDTGDLCHSRTPVIENKVDKKKTKPHNDSESEFF